MAHRLWIPAVLIACSLVLSDAAAQDLECGVCIEAYNVNKFEREKAERATMREVWEFADTIVLVRPIAKKRVWEATVVVVRAWKGSYEAGDQIEFGPRHLNLYPDGRGGGMCALEAPEINPFLLYFRGPDAGMSGCPSQFVPSPAKLRELDKLKARDARAAKAAAKAAATAAKP